MGAGTDANNRDAHPGDHAMKGLSEKWDEIIAALRGRATGTGCHDCCRPYGDEHGFPDLIISYEAWRRISPSGDDGGLLCPSCICKRLADAGIRCEGAFMSGPVISVSAPTMTALRRVENIELAIAGRDNRWGAVRELVPAGRAQEHKRK